MKFHLSERFNRLYVVLALAIAAGAGPAWSQETPQSVREAYFRAVGEHFEVELEEVAIIGEWNLAPDEVPVVLFLAQKAGVSPDALIGLRRRGQPWREVAGRFGLGPRDFHIPLPAVDELGPLTRAYGEFRGRPQREWPGVLLEDGDVVVLVNMAVLSEQTGVPPVTVLRRYEEAGSFVSAYPLLLRR